MPKQKTWVCSEGCPNDRVMCQHLEALLPPMRDKKLVRAEVANHSQDVFQVYRPTFDYGEFESLMRSYGFTNEWDLELLAAKYFYGMSVRQIHVEYNYTSFKTVHRRLLALHEQLVERGFKPRSGK